MAIAPFLIDLNSKITKQDIASNISTNKGTFNVKQAYVIADIVLIVYEIQLTTSLSDSSTILSGIPKAKGNYVNFFIKASDSTAYGYTKGTEFVSNGPIPSGTTIKGTLVYVKD